MKLSILRNLKIITLLGFAVSCGNSGSSSKSPEVAPESSSVKDGYYSISDNDGHFVKLKDGKLAYFVNFGENEDGDIVIGLRYLAEQSIDGETVSFAIKQSCSEDENGTTTRATIKIEEQNFTLTYGDQSTENYVFEGSEDPDESPMLVCVDQDLEITGEVPERISKLLEDWQL